MVRVRARSRSALDHTSPMRATRAGIVWTVKDVNRNVGLSSLQRSGVDTVAFGFSRAEYALTTLLPYAF